MSAPLRLQSFQVRNLAAALDAMSEIKRQFHVDLCAYGPMEVRIGEATIRVAWNEENGDYEIQDRNGD